MATLADALARLSCGTRGRAGPVRKARWYLVRYGGMCPAELQDGGCQQGGACGLLHVYRPYTEQGWHIAFALGHQGAPALPPHPESAEQPPVDPAVFRQEDAPSAVMALPPRADEGEQEDSSYRRVLKHLEGALASRLEREMARANAITLKRHLESDWERCARERTKFLGANARATLTAVSWITRCCISLHAHTARTTTPCAQDDRVTSAKKKRDAARSELEAAETELKSAQEERAWCESHRLDIKSELDAELAALDRKIKHLQETLKTHDNLSQEGDQ